MIEFEPGIIKAYRFPSACLQKQDRMITDSALDVMVFRPPRLIRMANRQAQAGRNRTNCQQVDKRTWPEIDRHEQDKFASV
jgi:hypothetical protein